MKQQCGGNSRITDESGGFPVRVARKPAVLIRNPPTLFPFL